MSRQTHETVKYAMLRASREGTPVVYSYVFALKGRPWSATRRAGVCVVAAYTK